MPPLEGPADLSPRGGHRGNQRRVRNANLGAEDLDDRNDVIEPADREREGASQAVRRSRFPAREIGILRDVGDPGGLAGCEDTPGKSLPELQLETSSRRLESGIGARGPEASVGQAVGRYHPQAPGLHARPSTTARRISPRGSSADSLARTRATSTSVLRRRSVQACSARWARIWYWRVRERRAARTPVTSAVTRAGRSRIVTLPRVSVAGIAADELAPCSSAGRWEYPTTPARAAGRRRAVPRRGRGLPRSIGSPRPPPPGPRRGSRVIAEDRFPPLPRQHLADQGGVRAPVPSWQLAPRAPARGRVHSTGDSGSLPPGGVVREPPVNTPRKPRRGSPTRFARFEKELTDGPLMLSLPRFFVDREIA